jgi:hypothetical protein
LVNIILTFTTISIIYFLSFNFYTYINIEMSKRFNKNIPYTFTGGINLSTSANLVSVHNSNTIANIITTGGNVGIGTTSPGSALHVTGTIGATPIGTGVHMGTDSVNNASIIQINQGGSTSGTAIMDFGYSGVNYVSRIIHDNNTKNLTILVNGGASSVTFQSSGNVGIGTNSPAYTLDVTGSLRSTGDIFIGNGTAAEALNLWDIPGAAWQLSTGGYNLSIRNGTVGSTMVDRVTIASTGNVGIGTTTPIGKMSVDYSGISANQNVLSLHTSNTATNDYNLIEAGHGASSTFVLKGNGNVGIGTTSPSEKLHINGNIILGSSTADSNVDYTISTPGQLTINANNASTQDNTFVALTLTSGVSSNQSNIILCGSANNSFRHIVFSTMNTERMRLSSSGNLGIGTSTPAYPLDIINTVNSSNQPFMRIGNSSGGAGNQVGIILSPLSTRTGGASSQIISIDDGNASAHLTLWTAPSGTGTASVERVRIQNNGNVGIGTVSPSFTLDVNGTIARSGVKLPRYDNGSFSGSASFSIPILFNDTQYNYAEFRVRYVTSAICNMNISASSYVNAAMNFGECALTTVKWNAQGAPVYATFSGVTSGIFADTVEMVGIDNNLIFRIVRATGTSTTGLRNHYSYDNVYCWSGVGTARGYGQGHIDNASVGGSPLQFVTFTCSTGTISGTYSSVHYY